MKQHKWHKEIKAWADGAEIQYKDGRAWWHSPYPEWDNEIIEYRIKPQPKEPKYMYVYRSKFHAGHIICASKMEDEIYGNNFIGKLKLEEE